MMELSFSILAIQIIVVIIIDLSGFVQEMKRKIWKWLKGNKEYQDFSLKPFDCSLCMTFWTGLIYIIAIHSITLWNLLAVLLLAYFTPITKDILLLIKEAIQSLLNKLWDRID